MCGFGLRQSSLALLNPFSPTAPEDWRSPKRWCAQLAQFRFMVPMHGLVTEEAFHEPAGSSSSSSSS
jgi:hypothetical protein